MLTIANQRWPGWLSPDAALPISSPALSFTLYSSPPPSLRLSVRSVPNTVIARWASSLALPSLPVPHATALCDYSSAHSCTCGAQMDS